MKTSAIGNLKNGEEKGYLIRVYSKNGLEPSSACSLGRTNSSGYC